MAFNIGGDFEPLEFNIPAGKGKTVTITLPPIDCVAPSDIEAMNEQMREMEDQDLLPVRDPNKSVAAQLRLQLKYFNPQKQKSDAIDALPLRYVNQIVKIWEDSEMSMGEYEPSTDASTQTDE